MDVSSRGVEPPVSRREILARIARVALPSYPTSVIGLCSGFVTAALVGRHCGERALAAIGLSGMITNVTGNSWLTGMSVAIATKSSQDWGGRNYRAIGVTLQRGYLILLASCAPLVVMWLNASHLLDAMGQDSEVSRLVGLYSAIRSPSLPFMSAKIVASRTMFSIGKPKIILQVSVLVATLNVTCASVLIPRVGFVGAPITMLICDVTDASLTAWLASRDGDFRKCWPGLSREALSGWGAFLRVSLPSFILIAIDLWSWDLIGFFAGWVSNGALAVQAIVPRIALLQFVIGAALRQGAMTAIGNLLGEGKPTAARRAARVVPALTVSLVAFQLLVVCLLREQIGRLFSSDQDVLDGVRHVMPLCLAFSFFDALQGCLTGIINAAGKQYISAPCVVFFYWVLGIPFGCYLAFKGRWGLEGLWTGMTVAAVGHVLSYSVLIGCIDWRALGHSVRERILGEEAANRHLASADGES